MKVNYFVLYPNNTYEFVEKESTFSELNFCKAIEDSVGDFCYFSQLQIIRDILLHLTIVQQIILLITHWLPVLPIGKNTISVPL